MPPPADQAAAGRPCRQSPFKVTTRAPERADHRTAEASLGGTDRRGGEED